MSDSSEFFLLFSCSHTFCIYTMKAAMQFWQTTLLYTHREIWWSSKYKTLASLKHIYFVCITTTYGWLAGMIIPKVTTWQLPVARKKWGCWQLVGKIVCKEVYCAVLRWQPCAVALVASDCCSCYGRRWQTFAIWSLCSSETMKSVIQISFVLQTNTS